MPPPYSQKLVIKAFAFASLLSFTTLIPGVLSQATAGEPEYFNPDPGKPFVFAIGAGYGISNNPCKSCDEDILNGITLSGSLGYRISPRFKVDFGPVVWIKGEDLFMNDLPSGERTTSKRMLVSFNGYYRLHKKVPVSLKLGAGVGSMVYSPERSTVSVDGKKNKPTEYFSGLAGTASLIYQLKISEKITIHPSLNFWYTDLNKQQIDYVSTVDPDVPSLTGDFRIQLFLNF